MTLAAGAAEQLWAPKLEETLSQGDVIREGWFLHTPRTPACVKPQRHKRGDGWLNHPIPAPGEVAEVVTRGTRLPGLVLSDSCEIDKDEKHRILVARVRRLSDIRGASAEDLVNIRTFNRSSLFPLFLVSGLGEGEWYADLRECSTIYSVDVPVERVVSMSRAGIEKLHQHLKGFLLRPPQQSPEGPRPV